MPTERRRWSAFHAARTGNVRLRVPASVAASIPSPIKRESECASLGDSLGGDASWNASNASPQASLRIAEPPSLARER